MNPFVYLQLRRLYHPFALEIDHGLTKLGAFIAAEPVKLLHHSVHSKSCCCINLNIQSRQYHRYRSLNSPMQCFDGALQAHTEGVTLQYL